MPLCLFSEHDPVQLTKARYFLIQRYFVNIMDMWETQVLASGIGMQKKIGGNHEFLRGN